MGPTLTERYEPSLLCRVRAEVLCALPVCAVKEIMRPLTPEPLAGAPEIVLGVAVIRGKTTPVVDAAVLLGGVPSAPSRYVLLDAGGRQVALAVDMVVGIEDAADPVVDPLPPLFDESRLESIAAVSTLRDELLIVLRSARLVPEHVWTALEEAPVTGRS
jgi:purine-binding chemotaxis protein CheW